MTITYTKFATFKVVNQLMSLLTGMQRDMRNNAITWGVMATNQSPDVATLAGYMTSAALSYQTLLGRVLTYKNSNPNWPAVTAMYTALGGDITEATTLYTQLKNVADQLAAASLTTYAQITTACNQITAAVQVADSLWPE